jgi:hypothetical protein
MFVKFKTYLSDMQGKRNELFSRAGWSLLRRPGCRTIAYIGPEQSNVMQLADWASATVKNREQNVKNKAL